MKNIDVHNLSGLNQILSKIHPVPIKKVEKLTNGNMNLTLRGIDTNNHSFIIKQGRDFVEKYPSIAAPLGRTSVEHAYYQKISSNTFLQSMSPKVVGACNENQILVLEDLGQVADGIRFYSQPDELNDQTLKDMTHYLDQLHQIKFEPQISRLFNTEMKELNAYHMFVFPFGSAGQKFIDNNLSQLSSLAKKVQKSPKAQSTAKDLFKLYMTEGKTLVHGDFYLGAILQRDPQTYIIDPEFCFWGYPEFDWGIFMAHMLMLGKPLDFCTALLENNQRKPTKLRLDIVHQHAAIEILRRLYGVAQLPFSQEYATMAFKQSMTELALKLL